MIPYFDAHCDTVSLCAGDGRRLRENGGHLDLVRLAGFAKAAQCFALFHDPREAPPEGTFAAARQQQAVFARELADNADLAVQCRTGADIRAAHDAGKIAAILTCEGADLLACDARNLDWAQHVGIRAVCLTWNRANVLSGSNLEDAHRGLSAAGRAFVGQAQARDIFIDVSHCSDAAFWDVMRITRKAVIASHSNARAVCGHSRNLTDDMFRAIADTGGAVGLNFYTRFLSDAHDASPEWLVRHLEHFLELGGEEHVGLGGDLDGCDPLVGNMRGVEDVPTLWQLLAERGYSSDLLEKLFFRNFLRVME